MQGRHACIYIVSQLQERLYNVQKVTAYCHDCCCRSRFFQVKLLPCDPKERLWNGTSHLGQEHLNLQCQTTCYIPSDLHLFLMIRLFTIIYDTITYFRLNCTKNICLHQRYDLTSDQIACVQLWTAMSLFIYPGSYDVFPHSSFIEIFPSTVALKSHLHFCLIKFGVM